jgi:amino acid transporter
MAVQYPMAGSSVSASLARDRLGVPAIVFFVLSAVAPLTVVAGSVTAMFAVTGLRAIPVAYVVVALVLAVFSVGFVAMARRITNAGAFYAFVARGLGRPAGVGVALMAVLAYNILQVALYGVFGVALADYASTHFGANAPWWIWSLAAWAVVAVLGLARVDLNGKVLAVLLATEVAVVIVLTVAGLANPAGAVGTDALNVGELFTPGVGALLVMAVLGYVGFEAAAVFSEEARQPGRTVPAATYLSLGLIGVVYAAASFAMVVYHGPDQVATVAGEMGPGMLFVMAGDTVATVASTLFLTSIFAAAISFHNAVGRYMFALGRERVLPAALGQTHRRTGAPRAASLVQSGIALAVIVGYTMANRDPLVELFYYGGATGGFGVLALLGVTSVAVVAYFARHPSGETLWRRLVAPAGSAVLLGGMLWAAVHNFAILLGPQAPPALAVILPASYAVVALLGVGWGLWLRARHPAVYATIGLGANATTGRDRTDAPTQPAWGAR